MKRLVTLTTVQWLDLSLEEVARAASDLGYDGLDLTCLGDHFQVGKALESEAYRSEVYRTLDRYGLKLTSLLNPSGHMILSPTAPGLELWGGGRLPADPEARRAFALEDTRRTIRAAKAMGVSVVSCMTGSSIWTSVYPFPPPPPDHADEAFREFARHWGPLLELCQECGVRVALEVHATQLAFDVPTAERVLEAVGHHPALGFNVCASNMLWHGVDPEEFVRAFPDRVFQAELKDLRRRRDGRSSWLASHLPFGDPKRAWNFCTPGRGEIDFEGYLRALNAVGYEGPLSVEWVDPEMDRTHGAKEALGFARALEFPRVRDYEARRAQWMARSRSQQG